LTDVVYISDAMDKDMANSRVQENDVLLNITGASIGRSAVYKHKTLANVNQHVCIIRTMQGINPYYVQLNLTSSNGQQQVDNNQAGGGREGLNFQQIAKITFYFPGILEQTAISNFFNALDNTIALYKRKLECLQELRKGYLQQMFQQTGESVPKLRFSEFTAPWEQQKLGEVAEFSKGSGYSKGDLTRTGTPIILYGRLYTRYETIIEDIDTFVEFRANAVLSLGGEVIVPSSGETAEDISRASVVGKQGVILGGDLNIIRANSIINPVFLAITISNGNQQRELSKRAQGKSVVHINNSDLEEVVLQHPSYEEQAAISTLFRTLDNSITLCESMFHKLKKLKNGYLQRMFI